MMKNEYNKNIKKWLEINIIFQQFPAINILTSFTQNF